MTIEEFEELLSLYAHAVKHENSWSKDSFELRYRKEILDAWKNMEIKIEKLRKGLEKVTESDDPYDVAWQTLNDIQKTMDKES